jgi:hypothetical protein
MGKKKAAYEFKHKWRSGQGQNPAKGNLDKAYPKGLLLEVHPFASAAKKALIEGITAAIVEDHKQFGSGVDPTYRLRRESRDC